MFEEPTAIATIMAVAQAVKKLGFPTKFIPALNLILGVIVGVGMNQFNADGLVKGLMIGASACGIFDFNKKCFIPAEKQ